MKLSVILPALYLNNDFLRCIYSIKSSLDNKISYEIICVVPEPKKFESLILPNLYYIKDDNLGIYSAMNLGIDHCSGQYLYFMGQDDIMLPGAFSALEGGINSGADLILANVYYGSNKIFKNYNFRHILVWRNWCHQGIIFNKFTFIKKVKHFQVIYKVQADHMANILISNGDLNTYRHNECIAWYSFSGFSSLHSDCAFRSNFPSIIKHNFGFFDFIIVKVRRVFVYIKNHV